MRSDTPSLASTRGSTMTAEQTAVRYRWATNRGLWAALAFALPALAPLAQPGVGDMADAALHIFRTVELTHLWREGIIYSRWAPDLAFGLGYPLFNFYAPLLYYLAGILHLAGLNIELAMKVTLVLITLLGCGGMYALAREWVGEGGAVLAAVAFTWAPFRLREIHFQGDFAQYLGLSLPPIVMWGLHRLAVTGKGRYLLISAAGYAALFLSHSISTMLFTPLIIAYVILIFLVRAETRRNVGLVALALLIGVGLSTFFWFPALYEKQFVQLDALRTDDFDFRRHFPQAWELIAPSVPLDVTAANPFVPFNLGLAQVLLAVPSLATLWRRQLRWATLAGWFGTLTCVFMCLRLSTPVWQVIPLLAFTEFPWRWLGIAALPLALLVGVSVKAIPRWRPAYIIAASLMIVLSTSPHIYPRAPFTHYDRATVADMMRDELKTQAIGTTSAGEYLPKGIAEKPRTSPLVPAYLEGRPIDRLDYATLPAGATAKLLEQRALSHRWLLSMPTCSLLEIHNLHYPGWSAYVDQQRVSIVPSESEHLISVQVPSGDHELELRFEDTAERQLANIASGATLVALVGFLSFRRRSPLLTRREQTLPIVEDESTTGYRGLAGREALAIGGLALAILVAKVMYIDSHTSWFRTASDPKQPPGMEHSLHIDFEDKAQLIGYSFDNAIAFPGARVTVTLYWRALRPIEHEYSAFVHLVSGNNKLTQQDNVHPGGIPTTSWRYDQFVRDEHPLTIPPDAKPGVYRLLAGLYDQKGVAPALFPNNGDGHVTIPLLVSASVPPSATGASYRLGGMVNLVAYEVTNPTIRQDEEVTVILYWQAMAKIDGDYTVFVHLYDSQGNLHGTGDRLPLNGEYPMTLWRKGEVIEDVHRVRLQPNSPPGDYTLTVGLYDLKSLKRLEARFGLQSRCPNDAIALQPLIQVRAQ